jgi:hypothetical protein
LKTLVSGSHSLSDVFRTIDRAGESDPTAEARERTNSNAAATRNCGLLHEIKCILMLMQAHQAFSMWQASGRPSAFLIADCCDDLG